ncbi:MAG: hypothetical protein HYW95_01905 [Candidatus Wildermuthbacteria bacterium]|nr:hypothetical protein [Candidatus Wildermuthbacteria bacterium]
MAKPNKVKVILRGAGLQYTGEVSPETAAEVMRTCLSTEEGAVTTSVTARPINSRPQEAPAEYLKKFAPDRNPDKIVALGAYLKEARGQDSFTPAEIRVLLRDAGEKLPGNLTRDLKVALRNAWIASDPSQRGTFYVTNPGFKAMQEGFPKTSAPRGGKRKKNTKRVASKNKKLKKRL